MSKILVLMVIIGTCRPLARGEDATLSPPQIYDRVVASTLSIKVRTQDGDRYVGAAFLVGDSTRAITAWHLISDAAEICGTYSDGTPAAVHGVIASDQVHDLALLRVSPTDRQPLPLHLKPPPIASRLYAIGSPRGYDFSISDGLLSQIRIIDGYPQYQLTCPFSPGNSGGPVVNSEGEVVGLSAWTKAGAQNLNFAIPSQYLASLCSASNPGIKPSADTTPVAEPSTQGVSNPDQNANETPPDPGPGPDDRERFVEHLRSLSGRAVHITVSTDDTIRSFHYRIPAESYPTEQPEGVPSTLAAPLSSTASDDDLN